MNTLSGIVGYYTGEAIKYLLLIVLVVLVSWVLGTAMREERQAKTTYEMVKSGEYVLRCYLPKGLTDIDPALITGYYEGSWQFTNGWSSNGNCSLRERGNKHAPVQTNPHD